MLKAESQIPSPRNDPHVSEIKLVSSSKKYNSSGVPEVEYQGLSKTVSISMNKNVA